MKQTDQWMQTFLVRSNANHRIIYRQKWKVGGLKCLEGFLDGGNCNLAK